MAERLTLAKALLPQVTPLLVAHGLQLMEHGEEALNNLYDPWVERRQSYLKHPVFSCKAISYYCRDIESGARRLVQIFTIGESSEHATPEDCTIVRAVCCVQCSSKLIFDIATNSRGEFAPESSSPTFKPVRREAPVACAV